MRPPPRPGCADFLQDPDFLRDPTSYKSTSHRDSEQRSRLFRLPCLSGALSTTWARKHSLSLSSHLKKKSLKSERMELPHGLPQPSLWKLKIITLLT